MERCNVAIAGATGAVGEALLEILAEREFPVGELYPLASERSAGSTVRFRDRSLKVGNLADFDFSAARIGLFSAGGSVSAEHVPRAAAAGCVVIDNTSHFRYEANIPLVVPEVNAHAIGGYRARNIIANPNCSTIQMLVALAPIHQAAGIKRITVATYQAVSGAGRAAVGELASQTAALLNGQGIDETARRVHPRQIAFNAIPQIDVFEDTGYTREEMKMLWETRKILGDDSIAVSATCVRVPVFYGHSEAVQVETHEAISAVRVRELLGEAPGVQVMDERAPGGYPTAVHDSAGKDAVFVGRIRDDLAVPNGISMWIVSDNVRKGAALNSVQIAECLLAGTASGAL